MPRDTDLHEWTVVSDGDSDYEDTFDSLFDTLDVAVEIRDEESNRDSYTPSAGSKYFATDTGAVYLGDGSSWTELSQSEFNVPDDGQLTFGDDEDYFVEYRAEDDRLSIGLVDGSDLLKFFPSEEIEFLAPAKLADDMSFRFGTGLDYHVHYDSSNDQFEITDGSDPLFTVDADGVHSPNGEITQNGVPVAEEPTTDVVARETSSGYIAYTEDSVVAEDTDGPTVLQTAVNNTPSGGTLAVRGDWTFTASDDIVLVSDDITVEGSNATFTTSVSNDEILYTSSDVGTEVSLSSDAAAGQRTITVSDASGFTEGELIGLKRDTLVDAKEESELHKIRSISGSDITVEDTLFFDYPTGDNAVAAPIDTTELHVEGIDFVGAGVEERALGVGGVQNGSVTDCTFTDVGQWSMSVTHSYNMTIEGNSISNSNMDGYGYGVIPSNGVARIRIRNNTFDECRHGISCGNSPSPIGLPRSVYVEENVFTDGLGNGVDSHGDVISMTARRNEVHLDGDRTAFFMGSINNVVEDNEVYGSLQTTLYQPRDDGQIDTVKVKNNDIWLDGDTAYDVPLIGLSPDNAPYKNIIIEDNVLHEGYTNTGFQLYPTTDTISIRGNILRGYEGVSMGDSGGTFVTSVALGGNATTIRISDNIFREATTAGGAVTLDLTGGDDSDVVIDNNTFINCLGSNGGGGAVEISGGTGVVLRDNDIKTNDATYLWYGFWLTNSTTESVIMGNTFAHPDNIDPISIDGHDGPDTLMLNNHNNDDARSVVPANPTEGWKYLDDGTNTSSGNPGYRYYDGSAWNDL